MTELTEANKPPVAFLSYCCVIKNGRYWGLIFFYSYAILHLNLRMYACMCVCMHVCLYIYNYICRYTHFYIHTYLHLYTYVYVYIYINIYTRTNTELSLYHSIPYHTIPYHIPCYTIPYNTILYYRMCRSTNIQSTLPTEVLATPAPGSLKSRASDMQRLPRRPKVEYSIV